METIKRATMQLKRLNLFKDVETMRDGNEQVLRDQILSTRVLLVLMVVSIFVFTVFTSLVSITTSVKVLNPSQTEFEHLQALYSDTLSCPCQQIAVPSGSFLQVVPNFHQVCSSGLVSQEWIASLFNKETIYLTPLDFRLTAAAQFRILSFVCSVSKVSVENIQIRFAVEQLVNSRALSRASFNEQANVLIQKFFATMHMQMTPKFGFEILTWTISQDRIYSALHTNAFQSSVPGSNKYTVVPNFYPLYDNITFDNNSTETIGYCDTKTRVTYKAGIYSWAAEPRSIVHRMIPQPPPIFVVPGMRVACFPYNALLAATLECFFDSACFNTTAQLISTLAPDAWPKPLNRSLLSSFLTTTSISAILDAQMVETWDSRINFSAYYNTCSPVECTHTLTTRSSILYVLTTLFGLFGGLLVALRIISPQLVQIFHYIQDKIFKTQNVPVPAVELGIEVKSA